MPKRALTKPLQAMIGNIGLLVGVFNQTDGLIIIDGAEDLAKALDKWAKESDRVYNTLEAMFQFSLGAEVTTAVAAIALPIAANHGLIPKSLIDRMGMVGDLQAGFPDNDDLSMVFDRSVEAEQPEAEDLDIPKGIKALGGGWYEITATGQRVHGKDNIAEALANPPEEA